VRDDSFSEVPMRRVRGCWVRSAWGVIACVVVQLAGPTPALGEDAPKPAKELQGEWKVVRVEFDGEDLPKAQVEKMSVVVKGDKLTFVTDTHKAVSRMTVRAGKKTGEIDLRHEDGKKRVVPGIWKIDGKRLWLCIDSDPDGRGRPTEFRAPAGTAVKVFVLERKTK
jgi:uncharacterized protein (TIGR03067 family)